ncbi:hypothetical protein C8D77_102782 [Mesorhizobium loti]|uniref:Uncharacterized protein n=1 Tax=Rhizobium loti TaxID=381 RepID=A0A8E3B6H2_RHILI|nr:hypothetical protein C8D77_102782 [Mesorhizobium loti]
MLHCTPLGARSPASYIPLGRFGVKGESGRRKGCFATMLPKVRTPFNACPAIFRRHRVFGLKLRIDTI